MAAADLTPFSYAVLTLVGRDGAGPHDLVRMARQGRVYWTAADSQWYSEPKRLAKLGFLRAEKRPGRTRERTHYTLTEAGRAALLEWAAEPARFPRIQHEAVTRLLLGDMVPDAVLVAGLQSMRTEIAEIAAQLGAADAAAAKVPHMARYLRLNHALARRILDAHSTWIDQVERELGDPAQPAPLPPPPTETEPAPEPAAPARRVFRAPFVD
jgi:DNA-binding PadR family transcriptional regulator